VNGRAGWIAPGGSALPPDELRPGRTVSHAVEPGIEPRQIPRASTFAVPTPVEPADTDAVGPADSVEDQGMRHPATDAAAFGSAPSGSVAAPRVTAEPADCAVEGSIPHAPLLLTGDRSMGRRCRFIAVNACSLASLVLGLGAIFVALGGDVRVSAVLLLGCVVFDGLDGALARKLGVATPFGAQMDSLADMSSFGVATPVVAYTWLSGSTPVLVAAPVCALVAVSAAVRLARFNVSPKNGCYFCGVPTTMAAAIIVVAALARPDSGRAAFAAMVALLALAMVSTFPYLKMSQLRRIPIWLWPVALVAVVLDPPTTLTILVGAYLLSGPLLWARQRRGIAV
jgi:CDP-diacylglycerol--serine O-phosphatidyltransferase